MKIIDIVKLVNKKLAGEQLVYAKMVPFLDDVIDDINSTLNASYPSFSSLSFSNGIPSASDVYDCFPDQYIRSVLVVGAAHYFYMADEEGESVAMDYNYKYQQSLFYMQRDFIDHVPLFYQSDSTGGVLIDEEAGIHPMEFNHRIWS